jgi:nucleotide-binding universal stress UspA family protein
MIRRILVAIDGTPASRVAQDLAIAIAKRQAAAVTGVGVVDRSWATAPQAVPIGGSAYKAHRDQVVLDELRHEVEAILGTFAEACRNAGILFSTVGVEGAPAQAIENEAEGCDLIVIGKDTNFHFEAEPDMTETVARLIRENARPVLVTSAVQPTGDKALVCYDGSVQASRAMHMFVLLGLAHDREVHLVSVAGTKEAAGARLASAEKLFAAHEIPVHLHGTAADADAAEIILAEADALRPGLLVMGAFGRTGLRELFLGSATRTLLRQCHTPMFIHH